MAPLKVLVTGASGFVASWIVKENISRDYFVRGTVRSTSKGEYLKGLFGDLFEYMMVEDVAKDGAFDEAVKDMDTVLHTASPFHYNVEDPQDLIGPAVGGTTSILKSILKNGPGSVWTAGRAWTTFSTVTDALITSSTAAIASMSKPNDLPKIFDEASWNNTAVEITEKEGCYAHPGQIYRASKVLAERAAWEFVDSHKNHINWDLITLQPPFIFGPVIHEVHSPSSLNTSSAAFLNFLKNEPPKSSKDLTASSGSYVDVRDVAWAHVEAITNTKLANKDAQSAFTDGKGRITLTAAPFTWQDVVDALVDAGIPLPDSTPRGEKGAGKNTVHAVLVNSVRAREELGLKFRSLTDVFRDTFQDFKEKGWVQA
ncbi:hypothetical protein M422DRAFT_28366 [Sphaerobolus stellatus SS14]|nr:hypothetical protein M422DRAFT_28366 [Sphaerobolus stellatus SS14]